MILNRIEPGTECTIRESGSKGILKRIYFYPTKFEIEFEDGVSVESIKEAETVYAIPTNSITDLVALELSTESLNIFRPLSKISNSNNDFFSVVYIFFNYLGLFEIKCWYPRQDSNLRRFA